MPINDWPEGERPREKLLERGVAALSDAELLAIFLRVGVVGKSAVDLSRELLQRFGGLAGLMMADREQLTAVHGMGTAKFAQLQAVMEMARRALGEPLRKADVVSSPAAVRDYLRASLSRHREEVFHVVYLNARNAVLGDEALSRGTLSAAAVYPRDVVRRALAHNAAAVIVAHNHPSGETEPSLCDQTLTRSLRAALLTVDVRLLDHIIIAGGRVISFADRGLL